MKITDSMGVTFAFTPVESHHVSSAENDSLRWTDIALYKTDTGKWVVHTVGMSDVYHTSPTSCKTEANRLQFGNVPDTAAPCPICRPSDEPNEDAYVLMEKDRHTVIVCDTDEDVPRALTARRNGQVYISRLSQSVMAKAGIESQVVQI